MGSDRELLELAAKAAGLESIGYDYDGLYPAHTIGPWNPLKDDGDALQLAVKLKMRVTIEGDFSAAGWQEHQRAPTIDGRGPWGWKEWHYDTRTGSAQRDPCAATRRAIVYAAAEIGRAKA